MHRLSKRYRVPKPFVCAKQLWELHWIATNLPPPCLPLSLSPLHNLCVVFFVICVLSWARTILIYSPVIHCLCDYTAMTIYNFVFLALLIAFPMHFSDWWYKKKPWIFHIWNFILNIPPRWKYWIEIAKKKINSFEKWPENTVHSTIQIPFDEFLLNIIFVHNIDYNEVEEERKKHFLFESHLFIHARGKYQTYIHTRTRIAQLNPRSIRSFCVSEAQSKT